MVASGSDTKRRRRDSSPLNTNPKRTKVHAQRKFAQGVSSLSNLLNLTPVKEKSDKSRSNGAAGNSTNDLTTAENTSNPSDVATPGKRALPARGAKKPSIEDMITFLCYRGTSALPPHLAHLNKAPSPEPASSPKASENSRSKGGDKNNKDSDKNIKKPIKSGSSAQKAVNAAQALKRKYQEQRIKKTTVSTISSKVKQTPLLRSTRSSAGAIVGLASKGTSKKADSKKKNATPLTRKRDSSVKDDSVSNKKSGRLSVGKQSNSNKTPISSPQASGSRGGLRSSGLSSGKSLRNSLRNLGSNMSLKKTKKTNSDKGDTSLDSKKLATSLSDFSSEDDQPLVKKHKPLVQVQKLIKKSIANIGRKMKMEPRRSKRGVSLGPMSPSSSSPKRQSSGSSQLQATASSPLSSPKEEPKAIKRSSSTAVSKDLNGVARRSTSHENQKKEASSTPKSTSTKMKKGYVMELVHDNVHNVHDPPLESRSRRGSRDLRDQSTDDKSTMSSETPKAQGTIAKKKDTPKTVDQSKKLVGGSVSSKTGNPKLSAALKSQVELSLSAVLKSPPDLRIPPSIKRPLTAVGITNPMAIAAAAAVVFKPSSSKTEEKVKVKELPQKKEDLKRKDVTSSQANSRTKVAKEEDKTSQSKAKQGNTSDIKALDDVKKEPKVDQGRITPRRKIDGASDEEPKAATSATSKDNKKTRLKGEPDSGKELVMEDDVKPPRVSKKKTKGQSDEDDETLSAGRKTSVKKNSDEEEHKLSSRSKRSTNRSKKKNRSSDEEEANDLDESSQLLESKTNKNAGAKVFSTESDSEADSLPKHKTKKDTVRQAKYQSTDEDVPPSKSTKSAKKNPRSYNDVSSENDSDTDPSDDDVSNAKPSTRSSAKGRTGGRSSLRLTRSGKKSPSHSRKQSSRSDTYVSSSDEDESESDKPSKAPKTRSKTVKGSSKKESSESSDEEMEKKSKQPSGNQRKVSAAAKKNVKAARSASSSSNSASSSDDDDDDFEDVTSKSKKKPKATDDSKSSLASESKDKRLGSRRKILSDNNDDENDVNGDEEGKKGRRSRSPRRSSRRNTKVIVTDDKDNDSSASDASSSESSPSQNRRVLRQRRGFFSFAEVDPPSDSEEEVLAATKASLEMINHQHNSNATSPNEAVKYVKASSANSQESISRSKSKSLQSNVSESVKSSKKAKASAPQVKKSLSKKRVKPPSEVQSNLNEELEKTLLSINLSPQSKTVGKSPEQSPSTPADCLVIPGPIRASPNLEKPPETTLKLPAKSSTTISCIPSSSAGAATSSGPVIVPAAPASVSLTLSLASTTKVSSAKSVPPPSKPHRNSVFIVPATSASLLAVCTASSVTSAHSVPLTVVQSTPKGSLTSCSGMPAAGSSAMSTVSTFSAGPVISSVIGMPSVSMSGSSTLIAAPLPGSMSAAMPANMPTSMPPSIAVSIPPSSVSATLSAPMALPMSAPMSIPLAAQLGIPMQTPLNVPMSGTMTLHSSGASGSPFLLPVQSMAPMLAPGQAIIKKESGTMAGMSNPLGNAPSLMVGMNPLVVNSNRGAFFLSTGSAMTMTASQQQMVPGPLMPSLLSLRLPDKPAGQQTIMASSPLYVPFAFGNPGIIQTQGQMQPQIQAMTGVSTITAMATNLQNSTSIQGTIGTNIQNAVAANIQSAVTTNISNAVGGNVPNMPTVNIQNPAPTSMQNTASISSAMTLSQSQGTGVGMKRQLVLATKNGPVSKLILSVGEDGSHVLAAASPNTLPTSEAQTLMSVMQPIKPTVSAGNVVTCQGIQTPTAPAKPSTIAPKLSSGVPKSVQPMTSCTAMVQKQQLILSSKVGVSTPALPSGINLPSGLQLSSSVSSSTLPLSSTPMPLVKCGALFMTSTSIPLTSSGPISTTAKSSVAPSLSSLSDSTKSSASITNASIRASTVVSSTAVKPDVRLSPTVPSIRPSVSISTVSSSTAPKLEEKPRNPASMAASSLSDPKVIKTMSEPHMSPLASPKFSSPVIVSSAPRNIGKPLDVKHVAPASVGVNSVTSPMVTSRIPSAHAALAALKSPSGTQSSSRAIAKTGSSRKPYSSAASFAATKIADSAEVSSAGSAVTSLSSRECPIIDASTSSVRSSSSFVSPKVTTSPKVSSPKPSPVVLPFNKNAPSPTVSGVSEQKRKGTEIELAPTHRTLSMLSTAFQGMGKERKRDVSKRSNTSAEISCLSENPDNIEKSGLDSLAEIATSLAERSVDPSTSADKRTPQHSLWANPAQILGKETLRVPGLPITANVGVNLPTKNDLAKMKSGAVLADAVEKRTDLEKTSKVKPNAVVTDCEKPSVSGLLTSSKADTPRQKVQKWLDDGSKGDVEHKANCSLLSNGNTCTCDVVEEDISNLNSLAEVCINMERINSPVKDVKGQKQSGKLTAEKKGKQDFTEPVKKTPPNESSPGKSSLPLNSHQMKVTWQNAFGVKSPSRGAKSTVPPQPKRQVLAEDLKNIATPAIESSDKNKKSATDQKMEKTTVSQSTEQSIKIDGPSIVDEGRKSQQRRSLLTRIADQTNSKLGSNAFSAVNESSVYAFEAETDTPPVNRPFRRRSKTSSRSDEEDSASLGSITTANAVHVSKDPVNVPIQVEMDESTSMGQLSTEKNGNQSNASPNDGSDVYYIPLGGQEGNEGDVRAVAVRLGKEGPNNRVVMSAKIVKKPPTFKHPNDTNEDGLPNKRVKVETAQSHSVEVEASTSNIPSGSIHDSKSTQEKSKPKIGDTSRSSAADSSSEDTSSLINMPTYSKDTRDSRNSMSPASSRNRSPMSDKISPSASQKSKKGQSRLNRQSSIESDASEKTKSMRRGTKSKSASSRASPSPSLPSTSSTSSGPSRPSQKSNRSYNGPVPGNVSEAPVFHPTEKEFQDPYEYIEKIRPIAEKYGLCRIVAPNSFKPDCNVEDDIRFTADNQYVHKMMDRWGPNAKEMRAIVKYIAQHNIHLKHAPLVGGMELDLPRLYTTVQNFGGLAEVMDKKRWVKVAETMRIPKSAQDRASKLDEVYCKCLLPYETLKTGERDNLFEMVEVEWEMRKERRDKRLAESAALTDQSESASQQDDDEEEDDEEEEDEEEDECIVKGRSMPLTTFFRTARNTIHMWFKSGSPSAAEVEHEFWRHVRDRNFHICVNSGSVDCSDPPYGFPTKNSPFAKHPWNLKVFSSSNGSILRSLGSVIGVTVPTLHFGMVFTTLPWYRDPHGLPWIEYLHTGAKKIWYGIPEHGAEKFRSAMQEVAPHYVRKKALWLASDTAMVPPSLLTERKVPLCRTVQEPGQFIVVFPRAHTSSVATGYIVSESVSYAPPSWLPTAMSSFKEMQQCNEPPLFSLDKLIFSIAEDPRTSLKVLNLILPSAMEILEREITCQQELKKKGVNSSERLERFKKKSSGKKGKVQKEAEDVEVMECEVCSTSLYLSMVVNNEDDTGYCLVHASLYIEQDKLDPSQCKLLYTYSQNELHEFCQNLLDRIETKTGKKGNTFSGNNSDSESSASTSTRT